MNKKEAIKKLENFKNLIDEWRSLDYSDPSRLQIRTEINKLIPLVHNLVKYAGRNKKFDISPPPAVGGVYMRGVDPFEISLILHMV